MNYLAHAWILPAAATPELILGAALPDLVRALDRRLPRLERDIAARLERAGARELALGVRAHQAADASFHALAAFRAGTGELRSLARVAEAAGGRVRGFFLAHVLLEILLDEALVEREPTLGARFHDALEPGLVARAARSLSAAGVPVPGLETFVARFRAASFFEDYATDPGVARRLGQVLARARQSLPPAAERALAAELPGARARIRGLAADLTDEPRTHVARELSGP